MTSKHRWVCAIVLAFFTLTPALAQEYRGRVQGSLTDETQLAVPGAQVTLRNDATGVAVTRDESVQQAMARRPAASTKASHRRRVSSIFAY